MHHQPIRTLLLSILLALLALCAPAKAEAQAQDVQAFDFPQGRLVFSKQGQLLAYTTDQGQLQVQDIRLDAGIDGAFLLDSLGYARFHDMNTWDLAQIVPKARLDQEPELLSILREGEAVVVRSMQEGIELVRRFHPGQNGLRVDASIVSHRSHLSEVQGIALLVQALQAGEGTTFRFPGNAPADQFRLQDLRPFRPKTAHYCAPLVRIEHTVDAPGLNLVLLHAEEKWSTGLWQDREGNLHAGYLVMAEGLIKPGDSYDIGPLYLQVTGQDEPAHQKVQALYQEMGYQPPSPLKDASGPMYSLHPSGTMDRGMNRPVNLRDFADILPGLQAMGIKTLWMLPIFEHSGRGVYEPSDQAVLDPRYGDDQDLHAFTQAAHEKGMRVLLDYVPHGPRPEDPLARDNPTWCSVHRNGSLQIEWDCVSFDMTNPDYLAYTQALSSGHAQRFDTDGGRVDCAMGGLSNWQHAQGQRASSSGLSGGLSILEAIRMGYEAAGKQALLLPENFHPLPAFAGQSDIFYDMPLYRVMFDLRQQQVDEATFASTLARWLAEENLFGVPGQQRLRFLGNHDTVSWTWDRARATKVYGVEKAKALWTLFALMDGVPFLYQGDEYSPIHDPRTLVDLRDFFGELYTARAKHLSPDMDIHYHLQDSALVVFTRSDGTSTRLVLVNLGAEAVQYALDSTAASILYGQGQVKDDQAILGPYQSLLLELP